jgi:hypothetical protein
MAASHDEDGAASLHMDDQRLFVHPPENELTGDRSGRCDAQRLHVSLEWGGRLLQGVLADVEQDPVLIGNSASTAKSREMTRNMGFPYPNAWFPATRRGRPNCVVVRACPVYRHRSPLFHDPWRCVCVSFVC